jgi:hypothetical protein
MVYASENLSLAALKLFVHVSPGTMPADLVSIRGELPDSVSIEEIDEVALPDNWRVYPAPAALQRLGTDWLLGQTSLVLMEIKQLRLEAGRPFHFEPRMFGK